MSGNTARYLEALSRVMERRRILQDVALAPYTTFRIGGPADVCVEVDDADTLAAAVQLLREEGIPWFLLGCGANILVADAGFRGVVLRATLRATRWREDDLLEAEAGARVFPDLIDASVARGMGGLHHFVGIPSTVGGALWQNLHFLSPAPARERTLFISEILESAEILDEEGHRRTVDVDHFAFGYDDSILHHTDEIVLSARFRLSPEPVEELRRTMRENLAWRDERHPDLWLYPSAGSVFKKIDGIGAGRLIDECGLKGTVYGGAGIFHKHANIIVNLGGATAAEVRHLMELARETVARETGYTLEPEISLVGQW